MPSSLFPARCLGSVVPHTPGGHNGCLYCAGTAQLRCPTVPGPMVTVSVVSVPVVSVPRQGRSQAMAPGWGAAADSAEGWPCVAAGLVAAVAVPVPRARGWVPGLGSGAGRGHSLWL